MSASTTFRRGSSVETSSLNHQLFESPQPAGRKITGGFTYLQRISKAATYEVWFPEELKREIDAQKARGKHPSAENFPAQWAAVRQFELLQESGNHKVYDLDPTYLTRAMLDLSRSMRAGGYRITVATIGCYQKDGASDELEILDRRLQEDISQMIHMLYLDQISEQANAENDTRLAAHQWDFRQALPHVGMVLGAGELFQRECDDNDARAKSRWTYNAATLREAAHRRRQAKHFFDILCLLPQNHIVHDTAIGLQLPELNGRNQWNYIAAPDETLGAFNRVLGALFDKFDGISLSQLQGSGDGHSEVKPSTFHMRGYGDHLSEKGAAFYESAALAFH